MGLYHGVTEESVVLLGTCVEHAASMADSSYWVADGEAGNEFGEEIDVTINGVSKHYGVNAEKGGFGVPLLEQSMAFSLYCAP